MDLINLFFYECPSLQFPNVETIQGPRPLVPAVCRILCRTVRGLSGKLVPWPGRGIASIWYIAVLWEFGLRCASRVGVACSRINNIRPDLLCRGRIPRARGMATYLRDGYWASRQYMWLLLLLLKEFSNVRQGESRLHSISPKTPAPQYKPIERKKWNGNSRRQKGSEHLDRANKKALALLFKLASATASNTGAARSFHRDSEKEIKVLLYW